MRFPEIEDFRLNPLFPATTDIFGKKFESSMQLWSPFSFPLQLPLECYYLYAAIVTEYPYLISLLTVTTHVVSSLKILSHNLIHQPKNSCETERNYLEHHFELIQLVKLMNINYGEMLTVEILCSSIQACFSAYQIVDTSKNIDSQFVLSLIIFFVVWCLPFLICFCGQWIEREGDNMFRIMFQGSWYERSPKHRKTVLLMMLMMSKPLQLHYKMSIFFNMQRFAAVIQTSYSFITMLRAVLF